MSIKANAKKDATASKKNTSIAANPGSLQGAALAGMSPLSSLAAGQKLATQMPSDNDGDEQKAMLAKMYPSAQ